MSDHDKAADYRRRAEAIEELAPTEARAAILRELADELDGGAPDPADEHADATDAREAAAEWDAAGEEA